MSTNSKQFLPRQLAGGESSSVVLHTQGSKKFIIKHSVHNDLKKEVIALSLAKKAKVPVPAVLKYENRNLFLEFLTGRNIKNPI